MRWRRHAFVTAFARDPSVATLGIIDNDRVIRRGLPFIVSSLACVVAVVVHAQTSPATSDPLARAIAEASSTFAAESSSDQLWTDAKAGIETSLNDARRALEAGRRWFALERLAQARQSLLATRFALQHPAERADLAAFEREWTRLGETLGGTPIAVGPLDTIRPAALRALAEVAAPQVRINYDAGLEYGRNTQPEYGLYYVGVADAQQQFVRLARTLTSPAADGRTAPRLRSIADEIAVVQRDLLSMYRPPASTERHSEFIVASSALKEARQYDALGLRHAALLRLLQASQRTAMLHVTGDGDNAAIAGQLKALRTRLASGGVDNSIGLLMLERAEAALDTNTAVGRQTALAIATDTLPRYFAALEPARPATTPRGTAAPIVTVTLVRWPFT
jgi:hypothetical protein